MKKLTIAAVMVLAILAVARLYQRWLRARPQ